MIKSGFNFSICSKLAELNPLTIGLGGASGGGVKKAVTPATWSQAPIRQNQSAASADKQTMRSGGQFTEWLREGQRLSGKDSGDSRYHNKSRDAHDTPRWKPLIPHRNKSLREALSVGMPQAFRSDEIPRHSGSKYRLCSLSRAVPGPVMPPEFPRAYTSKDLCKRQKSKAGSHSAFHITGSKQDRLILTTRDSL